MQTSLYIGLMSGTSLDGIDAVILKNISSPEIVASHFQPYSTDLSLALKALIESPVASLANLSTLNVKLSQEYAQVVSRLLADAGINNKDISAIGCHGQTVYHQPASNFKYSMQLGSGAHLAELSGIPVVTDFRNNDMALGGQGAPLVCAFHHALCGDRRRQLIINLGGIANVTWIDTKGLTTGFDTGPANCLLDNWYQNHHQKTGYDKDGVWAASSEPDPELVSILLKDSYFSEPAPKSTGKEYFNLDWLNEKLSLCSTTPDPDQIQASLVQLTVQSIAMQVAPLEARDIYICGGGRNNRFLMTQLQESLGQVLKSTDELGIAPDFLEAAAFAWLAEQRINLMPGSLGSVTGASTDAISGAIYLPSRTH